MTKEQFLVRLKNQLQGLREQAIKDILYDYEEHFSIATENGKTEEEICRGLGSPEQIASQYKLENAMKKAEDSSRPYNLPWVILTGMGLGFFNLIFVLGIYLAILGVMLGLFIVSVAIFISGGLIMMKVIFPPWFLWMSIPFNMSLFWGRLAALFTGIGFSTLGILLILLTIKLTEWIYKGTLAYLKANISIIQRAGEKS